MNTNEFNKIVEISSKEKLDKVKEVLKEFDEDENMETFKALQKIREVVK